MNINIQRMGLLLARAKQRTGRDVETSDVAAVLWPRLTTTLGQVACATSGETGCLLRDVIYYGPDDVLGGEVFAHAGVTAREWLSSAKRNAHRILTSSGYQSHGVVEVGASAAPQHNPGRTR